jgi:two-component system, sensor histidine kinase and response regulator
VQVLNEDPLRIVIRYPALLQQAERARFFSKTASNGAAPNFSGYAAKRLAEAQRGGVVLDSDEASGLTLITVVLLRSSLTSERG